MFFVSLVHHHHPALLHRHALILNHLMTFLMAFFTLVLKPPLSQSLSLRSSYLQADLMNFDHSKIVWLAVTGGSIGKCGCGR